jgi:tungstate transport system ATP-binding protein
MLEVRELRHAYAGRDVLTVPALTFARHQRTALIGPNGSGKSTLLRLLAFLEPPTAGAIWLDGRAIVTARDRRAARRRVTLVEQRPMLFRGTVLQNVAWPLRARGVARRDAEAAARTALDTLRAGPLAGRDARAVSEGEAQRIAISRALAARPDVLLLDEPASAADRAARHDLDSALAQVQAERGVTICAASHQLEEAYRWADAIVALHDGALAPVTPENLFRVELPGGAGMQTVRIGPVTVEVLADRAGAATLAIPPDEILLATEPLHASARNVLRGRIVRAAAQGAAVRVTVDVGIELIALVTQRSFDEMRLGIGTEVYAAFKSVAVRVV